jgi:hypothetical protein
MIIQELCSKRYQLKIPSKQRTFIPLFAQHIDDMRMRSENQRLKGEDGQRQEVIEQPFEGRRRLGLLLHLSSPYFLTQSSAEGWA